MGFFRVFLGDTQSHTQTHKIRRITNAEKPTRLRLTFRKTLADRERKKNQKNILNREDSVLETNYTASDIFRTFSENTDRIADRVYDSRCLV